MGNFAHNGSLPWPKDTEGTLWFICKEDIENLDHFLLDCSQFKENFDCFRTEIIVCKLIFALVKRVTCQINYDENDKVAPFKNPVTNKVFSTLFDHSNKFWNKKRLQKERFIKTYNT